MSRVLHAVALALAFTAFGCTDDDSAEYACLDTNVACGDDLRRSTIDTGEGFELDAGRGVGVFVEYEGEGQYRVSTTCDSTYTGYSCNFDVLASIAEGGELIDFAPGDLEDDSLDEIEPGILNLRTVTEYDIDSFTLQTEPGAVLAIDVLLDCGCGNPYLFWIGGGAIHGGSPSTTLELEPSTP